MAGMSDPFAAFGGRAIPPQQQPPAAPAPAAGGDPFAQFGGSAQPAAQQRPPVPSGFVPLSQSLQMNEKNEGTYLMSGQDGQQVKVPFSKVPTAQQNGYGFAGDLHFNPWWLVPGSTMGQKRHISDAEATYLRDRMEADTKGFGADPNSQQLARQSGVVGMEMGAARGAAKTAVGLHDLATHRPQKGEQPSAIREFANEDNQTFDEGVGEAAENLGEFFTGEELLGLVGKGTAMAGGAVGLGEQMKHAQQLATTIEKMPLVGKYLRLGMEAAKQGLVAGGQTFVKTGGDAGAAAETAGLQTVIGGGVGAALDGMGGAIAKRATTLEDVGGVETPVPAEVRNQKPTPQQTAGQQAIQNAAQDTARTHLEEANETRTAPATDPALPAQTGPFEFTLRGVKPTTDTVGDIAHPAEKIPPTHSRVPEGGTPGPQNKEQLGSVAATIPDRLQQRATAYAHGSQPGYEPMEDTASGGGIIKTQDPNIVKAHIAHLNQIIEGEHFPNFTDSAQQTLLDARADAQRQLAQYHKQVSANLQHVVYGNEPSSVLKPIDVQKTVQRVGSFTDAADELEKTATQGYDLLNDVTGDRFNALRQENKDAWNAYKGASGEAAQKAAREAVDKTNQQMTELLDGLRGIVDDRMLDGFNDAYRNAQGLREVAHAVDSTFTGNPLSSKRSWEYRGFNGGQLMTNLSRLQQQMGTGRLTRLIGERNLNTLFQVAELNRTQSQRAQFGQAISTVAKFLSQSHVTAAGLGATVGWKTTHTWEGAAAGAAIGGATGAASSAVMRSILTNPKVAENLIFALQSGARPERYGPFIAELIQKAQTQDSKDSQPK